MAQLVTLNEIMTAVRELTFDRFIIPAFAVKQMGKNYYLDIDKEFVPTVDDDTLDVIKGKLSIYTETVSDDVVTKEINVELVFNSYRTLESIMDALIAANIVVAYTPYFRGTEPSNVLIQITHKELSEDFTAFRRYFFSDSEIKDTIVWYYFVVLNLKDVDLTEDVINKLIRPSERHIAIWCSYQLTDKRRLYEQAANAIGQSFTDGSDYSGSSESNISGAVTSVQIGSVFSVSEDPKNGYFYEDYNRVGSDNVWGDRYSFWYKLMLYLRDLLEVQFGDYSLRKNNVIPGYIALQRELDFRSYFDSYPFTLSPLSRGILSKTT